MGTAIGVTSTVRLSPGWNAFYYWGVWAICIIGIGIVLWAALKSKRWGRWTTQDILIVAALGVLLEVYDNIIGDQFISPLINPIPGADFRVDLRRLPLPDPAARPARRDQGAARGRRPGGPPVD